MWHQLSTKIVQFMAPLNPLRPPDVRLIRHHLIMIALISIYAFRFP